MELKALNELARNANDRIYIGFDKHAVAGVANEAVKAGNYTGARKLRRLTQEAPEVAKDNSPG